MNEVDFRQLRKNLNTLETELGRLLQWKKDDAKRQLGEAMNLPSDHSKFISACRACNALESELQTMEKAAWAMYRIINKYDSRNK